MAGPHLPPFGALPRRGRLPRHLARALPLAVLVAVGGGCGQGESPAPPGRPQGPGPRGASGPPAIAEIRIVPEQPRAGSAISAQARASDPGGQAVAVEYQWLRNGAEIPGATGQTLTLPDLRRGDLIAVRATPVAAGVRGSPVTSLPLTVHNSPPVLTRLAVLPREARRGDVLRVEVEARDPDQDPLLFTYQWLRNGEEIPGATGAALALPDLRKGDRISVRVTVADPEERAAPRESPPVTLLNTPPRIVAGPRWETGPDGTITYRLAAEDPDGDPLTFTLSPDAPRGMTLDQKTGVLRYRPPAGAAGTHRVWVTVDDGDGGAVRQELVVVVRQQ